MTGHRLRAFELHLAFASGEAVVGVHGEVDVFTTATLDDVLGALIGAGHPTVVLDLTHLLFIDAAGLGTIAGAAARLRASGRTLGLRAVPAMTKRLLEITGVGAGLVQAPSATALGPEQADADRPGAVAAPIDLTRHLGDRRSTGPRDVVVDAALRLVTVLADATVAGAEGVSVSLERRGRLATVAASDDRSREVDDHQYATGQGPCLAAAAEGHWFHSESLADEGRWPDFVPHAIEAGMRSILSSPLVVADRPVGSLNIYSTVERSFGPAQQELAALYAEQASSILVDVDHGTPDERVTKHILDALLGRERIARAQGALMARHAMSADESASALRRMARAAGTSVATEAAEVLTSTAPAPGPLGPDRA